MTILDNCKLTYFNILGRGEATRLALTIGGIAFTDERIAFSDWPTLKPTTPWGSLPQLTFASGDVVAQQRSMLRLVGKETGLYPSDDPIQGANIDSLMDACEDVGTKCNDTGRGLPKEEKEAARAKCIADKDGAVYAVLKRIDAFIEQKGSNGYAVGGDALTVADLFIFTACGSLVSGLFDGIPLDAIEKGDFPHIMAVRKTVRSHPAVTKWYDGLDESVTIPASYGPFN
jgi:glutathione S-transferase